MCLVFINLHQTASQIGAVESEMALIMMTEELHVWQSYQAPKYIPCQLFVLTPGTVRTQSIYAVMFQQKITSQSCLAFPPA